MTSTTNAYEVEQELRRKAENRDVDGFVFTWFNDRYPDEMTACLKGYTDRAGGVDNG